MNIRNQNKNLQSMEDELNEIKKLSLYSRDLFASFDALTVAINNNEEKYKAFFLGLLEESKKLAAELHT